VYTREQFDRLRKDAERVRSRAMTPLAIVAVGLGLAQIALIRWADLHLERAPRLTLEGGVFLAYMALVGALLVNLIVRAARLRCPARACPLEGLSERVAAATGRCDACGGAVIG
jgi:hypothetical protein